MFPELSLLGQCPDASTRCEGVYDPAGRLVKGAFGDGELHFWLLKTAWVWPGCLFWGRQNVGFSIFFRSEVARLGQEAAYVSISARADPRELVIFSPRIAKPCVAENHGGKHDLRQNCSSIIAEMVRNKANLNVRSAAGCRCSVDKANLGVKASFRLKIITSDDGRKLMNAMDVSPKTTYFHGFYFRRFFYSGRSDRWDKILSQRSSFGTTPLSLACHAKHVEAVEAPTTFGGRRCGAMAIFSQGAIARGNLNHMMDNLFIKIQDRKPKLTTTQKKVWSRKGWRIEISRLKYRRDIFQ